MTDSDKFMCLFGGIFFPVGMFLTILGLGGMVIFHEFFGSGICLLLGIVFGSIGGGILINQFKIARNRKKVQQKGQHYTGKIYGYLEDKSCTMNGDYLVNIKVHYFDERGIEREAIVPTGFTKGNGDYPIGATIDIIGLGSSYTWVEGSVRFERIPREEELMDDKPLAPDKLNMIATSCPNCGASFSAAKGYVNKCPYCCSALNC